MQPVIVIPAYQPQQNLVDVVNSLLAGGLSQIIVVNDGSSYQSMPIFEQLTQIKGVTVLNHAVNLGKGAALKTAFNYALVQIQDLSGIITADADGQHLAPDVLNLAKRFSADANCLWLGSREFEGNVPLRSRFGNELTKKVFGFFIGKSLADTQTGLRGIPTSLLKQMLKISANGYEFELEMLIVASNSGIAIREMPIKTIYEDGNKSSHFNPIVDSIKIYFVFIRFSALSIISAMVDFVVFIGMYFLTKSIFYSLISSRIVAGVFNFICNKLLVFKSNKNYLPEFIKYVLTVIALMTVAYFLIRALSERFGVPIALSKIIAESCLFLISFAIQRTYIFGSSERK